MNFPAFDTLDYMNRYWLQLSILDYKFIISFACKTNLKFSLLLISKSKVYVHIRYCLPGWLNWYSTRPESPRFDLQIMTLIPSVICLSRLIQISSRSSADIWIDLVLVRIQECWLVELTPGIYLNSVLNPTVNIRKHKTGICDRT